MKRIILIVGIILVFVLNPKISNAQYQIEDLYTTYVRNLSPSDTIYFKLSGRTLAKLANHYFYTNGRFISKHNGVYFINDSLATGLAPVHATGIYKPIIGTLLTNTYRGYYSGYFGLGGGKFQNEYMNKKSGYTSNYKAISIDTTQLSFTTIDNDRSHKLTMNKLGLLYTNQLGDSSLLIDTNRNIRINSKDSYIVGATKAALINSYRCIITDNTYLGDPVAIINGNNCLVDSSGFIINSVNCETHYNPISDYGYGMYISSSIGSKIIASDYASIQNSDNGYINGRSASHIIFGLNDSIINCDNSAIINSLYSKLYNCQNSTIISGLYIDGTKNNTLYTSNIYINDTTFNHVQVDIPSDSSGGGYLINAITGITDYMIADNKVILISGNGGAVDISATPQIAKGVDGQIIELWCTNNTNTVRLDDGDGLRLSGGVSFIGEEGDVIVLRYMEAFTDWCEISRSDN